MTVKLASKLPRNLNANGLPGIEKHLIDSPEEIHYVVAAIRTQKITNTIDSDGGTIDPTAMIVHVEVMAGARESQAREMLASRMTDRTGITQLPFEAEDQ